MIKRTFSLDDLFILDTGFYGWCLDSIGEIIPNVLTTTSLQDNFTNYMLKPLWRKYQYVNANYDDNDSGKQQFQNDFANQLQDICVEFYTYVKANVKHFEGLDNKTDLIKQVSSVVAPINDIIDQTADDTTLAKGTTAQNIGTTLYNDSVWLSMFNTYMTPQRKGEMLNRFSWLFLIAYYTGEKEQGEEYVLEVSDTLNMRTGDQVIEFEVDEEITEVVVTIEKPATLIPSNIVNGVNIGGVVGTHECDTTEPVIEQLSITRNGVYNAPSGVDGYNPINVNVPSEGTTPVINSLDITSNGTYTAPSGVDGYSPISVNVQPTLQSKTITENGTYTADSGYYGLSQVVVEVESGGTTLTTKEKWQLICSWLSNAWLMLDSETTYQYMEAEDIVTMYQNASAIQTACANIYNKVNSYLSYDNLNSYISSLNTLNNSLRGLSFSFQEPREGKTFPIVSDVNSGLYIILNISATIDSTNYGLVGFAKWSE